MESNKNPYLTQEYIDDTGSRVKALVIVLIINTVCIGGCFTCLYQGQKTERVQHETFENKEL